MACMPLGTSRVVLALGSNLGNRPSNLRRALVELRAFGRVEGTSRLYDTAPEYVADQPRFLNAAVELTTELSPLQLLRAVKGVERGMGRHLCSGGGGDNPAVSAPVRFGPRPIDIDLLFMRSAAGEAVVQDEEELTLPHPRISERAFVLKPLADLDASRRHCVSGVTVEQMLRDLAGTSAGRGQLAELHTVCPLATAGDGGEPPSFVWGARTYIMGVVNATPDSFSDGGAFGTGTDGVEAAVAHGLAMARMGVDVLDVGGHSTKPGFESVGEQEEIERVAAVVRLLRARCDSDAGVAAALAAGAGLRSEGGSPRIALSIDTFRPSVAEAAIAEGADIVNDVSGGLWSAGEMYRVAAEHAVPLVLMDHGTDPVSLQAPHATQAPADVDPCKIGTLPSIVGCVAGALQNMQSAAAAHGVPRWQLIVDPGLGFAKDGPQVQKHDL